jgi:hypothetical protein
MVSKRQIERFKLDFDYITTIDGQLIKCVSQKKSIEGHRMEIVWTFVGNRMDLDYP